MSQSTLIHPTHRSTPMRVREGRTFLTHAEGVLVYAKVWPTAEKAEAWAKAERDAAARKGWENVEFSVI